MTYGGSTWRKKERKKTEGRFATVADADWQIFMMWTTTEHASEHISLYNLYKVCWWTEAFDSKVTDLWIIFQTRLKQDQNFELFIDCYLDKYVGSASSAMIERTSFV